jgi:membrane-associated phospholipid phosphatase
MPSDEPRAHNEIFTKEVHAVELISTGTALFALLMVVFAATGVLGTIFWVWMLIEAATKEPDGGSDRIVWVLIILLTHMIGAALYFFARRPRRRARAASLTRRNRRRPDLIYMRAR